jgi:hypothetical protein
MDGVHFGGVHVQRGAAMKAQLGAGRQHALLARKEYEGARRHAAPIDGRDHPAGAHDCGHVACFVDGPAGAVQMEHLGVRIPGQHVPEVLGRTEMDLAEEFHLAPATNAADHIAGRGAPGLGCRRRSRVRRRRHRQQQDRAERRARRARRGIVADHVVSRSRGLMAHEFYTVLAREKPVIRAYISDKSTGDWHLP